MKHWLVVLSLGIFSILLGCSDKTVHGTTSEQLIVGTNANYAPYVWIDKGEVVGFDKDILDKMGEKLGKKIIIKDMSFDSLILALNQNKVDIIMGGISITPSRMQQIDMIPYQGEPLKSFVLVFWEQPKKSIQTWNDLKGMKIAVQTGTLQDDFIQSIPDVITKTLDGNAEIVMDVQHHKSEAALFEPHIANDIKHKFPQTYLIELPLPNANWVMGNGIGVSKHNSELSKQISETIEALKSDGSIKMFEKKWFKSGEVS
ncbi:MAG: transporter substrate-binding domain-containing protein [Gammaproteobacteria bacterium]